MTKLMGIARVSGITIDREDTNPIARPVEQHPAWCFSADDATANCGDHLGEPTNILATAGGFHIRGHGALIPRIEVAAATQDGALAVYVALFDPAESDDKSEWVSVNLLPAAAREFAAALEAGRTTRATGIDQSTAWLAPCNGEPATVVVIDRKRKVLVSARLYAHEVKTLADAIISAAELVEGR